MNVKLGYAVVGIAAALTLTSCATTAGTQAPATAGNNRPAATSAVPVEPAVVEPAPAEDGPLAFGDTKTYTDGLSITVSKGKAFKPGEYAIGKGKFFVKYTITIVNGTSKMFEPAMFTASAQSANVEGEQVFDGDMGSSPSTKLLKGREAKFVIGFGVEDLKDVVLEARPSFEHESAIFN